MKVLVVVDMQNDFIDGALGTEEAKAIVPKVVQKIREFDGFVITTQDAHGDNYLETQEGKNLPVPHCIYGTNGYLLRDEVHRAVEAKPMNTMFIKETFGCASLALWLDNYDSGLMNTVGEEIEEVVLVGLCTDICVISNAMLLKAFLPEVPITVDASCCAGVTPESHKNALNAMRMCQIRIVGEDE